MLQVKIALIDLGDLRDELNEPLGIECISSRIIREYKINVDMYWQCIKEPELNKLLEYDIVGLSMNIGTLPLFDKIYNYFRVQKPNFPLVLGGCIPTFAYRELIDKYANIICIYGEGENALYEIVSQIIRGVPLTIDEDLCKICNLAFKLNQKNVITPPKSLDLSSEKAVIRHSAFLQYIKEHSGIVRVEGSRGCSWNKCSFCCVNAKYADPSWRSFSQEKILHELIELSEAGFVSPYFTDEDFFGRDYQRAIRLGNAIIDLKRQGIINPSMNFFISILAADAINELGREALYVLKEAGLREVFLGIESFEKQQLQRYNKKASIDTNIGAIETIKAIGLQIDSGYILFDPVMSFEELGTNICYIKSLALNKFDSRSLKRLRLQPLTAISEKMSNQIIEGLDINNLEYKYTFSDKQVEMVYERYSRWENEHIQEIWKIQAISRGEINEKFRNNLKSILGKIRELDFDALCNIYDAISKSEIPENIIVLNDLEIYRKELIGRANEIITGIC